MVLIYDTETTGLPRDWNAPISDSDNWPRLVQLAWQLHDETGKLLSRGNMVVKPDGFTIPFNSTKIHGITTERALAEGMPLDQVIGEFMEAASKARYVMGHNVGFDVNVVGAELLRLGQDAGPLTTMAVIDSKDEGTEFCAIPWGKRRQVQVAHVDRTSPEALRRRVWRRPRRGVRCRGHGAVLL